MHIEVFKVDAKNGWAAALYYGDAQMGEAMYSFHKADAKSDAVDMAKDIGGARVKVFTVGDVERGSFDVMEGLET